MNILGIDSSRTKTVCVLMNETGEILGRGVGEPANYQMWGLQRLRTLFKPPLMPPSRHPPLFK